MGRVADDQGGSSAKLASRTSDSAAKLASRASGSAAKLASRTSGSAAKLASRERSSAAKPADPGNARKRTRRTPAQRPAKPAQRPAKPEQRVAERAESVAEPEQRTVATPVNRTPTNSVPATTAQHHSSPNGHAPVGLTVREVLAAPCLANARILAGESGLDRIVQRLNVMEVPDILPWVKPYELLLTTGYPLRDDPDALVALLGDLDDRGLAALAIKLHRYLDEVPPRVLEEADRRGFPVIEFPIDVG